MSEKKDINAKVFIFGPWVTIGEDGKGKVAEEGQKVADWLRSDSTEVSEEIGKLLRIEIQAEKEYREMVLSELNILRSRYLDHANAVVDDLTNPGKTIIEAYNNGIKMGEHTAGANMAQWLSDLIDKVKLQQAVGHERTEK